MVEDKIKIGGRRWGLDRIDDIPQVPGVYILFYQGKRRVIGESKNLRKSIEQHASVSSTPFTEFTWYKTTSEYGHGLARRLKRIYRSELQGK